MTIPARLINEFRSDRLFGAAVGARSKRRFRSHRPPRFQRSANHRDARSACSGPDGERMLCPARNPGRQAAFRPLGSTSAVVLSQNVPLTEIRGLSGSWFAMACRMDAHVPLWHPGSEQIADLGVFWGISFVVRRPMGLHIYSDSTLQRLSTRGRRSLSNARYRPIRIKRRHQESAPKTGAEVSSRQEPG